MGLEDIVGRFAIGRGPLLKLVRLGDDNSDTTVLEAVSVHHALSDIGRLDEYVLDFLGRDILSLGQFENVLAAIQNLNRAIWVNDAHVSRVEITPLVDSFSRLVRSHEVAFRDARATDANLASWVRLVRDPVLHLGQVLQPDGAVQDWPSNRT